MTKCVRDKIEFYIKHNLSLDPIEQAKCCIYSYSRYPDGVRLLFKQYPDAFKENILITDIEKIRQIIDGDGDLVGGEESSVAGGTISISPYYSRALKNLLNVAMVEQSFDIANILVDEIGYKINTWVNFSAGLDCERRRRIAGTHCRIIELKAELFEK